MDQERIEKIVNYIRSVDRKELRDEIFGYVEKIAIYSDIESVVPILKIAMKAFVEFYDDFILFARSELKKMDETFGNVILYKIVKENCKNTLLNVFFNNVLRYFTKADFSRFNPTVDITLFDQSFDSIMVYYEVSVKEYQYYRKVFSELLYQKNRLN
ncbi:hypothetical protein [Paenibacillus sp. FSL P4-0502]|uniref:hypothetical protein n=1 Tax=Paenibacillus sp. FSL P4-0502 TaxID=2975319 RepID=UPI0030F50A8D